MTNVQAGLVLQHLRRLVGPSPAVLPPDAQLLEHFTSQRDEAAFAALVRRHGPMVLNVCRSVLHHEQDAEDAFQATFLVLARKASSLWQPAAVAGWLHEVAYHVAVKARADAARRRAQERKVSPVASADPTLDMTLRELHRVLHEELRRLPEKYRLPLVLCYLEGRSQGEAAGHLGCSKGTLRGRLDRGREQLRRRLASRGVTLSAPLGATAVTPKATAAALVDLAVRAAIASTVSGAAAGVLSTRVAALAEGVARTMFPNKIKIVCAVLLTVGLVAGAGALAHQVSPAGHQPGEPLRSEARCPNLEFAAATPPSPDDRDSIVYSGRVLGPDGQPVAGARLFLTLSWSYVKRPSPSPTYATSGSDGRFAFAAPKSKFGKESTVVVAIAAGFGPGWVEADVSGDHENLTIPLVKDDVPIAGQVVDLQGQPVRGAAVRVMEIHAAPKEDLGP